MLLELLADVIDHQPKKSTQVKNAALGRKARRTEFGADS
jgi:hypothetical protein